MQDANDAFISLQASLKGFTASYEIHCLAPHPAISPIPCLSLGMSGKPVHFHSRSVGEMTSAGILAAKRAHPLREEEVKFAPRWMEEEWRYTHMRPTHTYVLARP